MKKNDKFKTNCCDLEYCTVSPICNCIKSELKTLKSELEAEKAVVDFYADTENWTRRETFFWENIERSDCADYPHITRDVKLTGGKLARQRIKERNK
jgi:hypothetical protein